MEDNINNNPNELADFELSTLKADKLRLMSTVAKYSYSLKGVGITFGLGCIIGLVFLLSTGGTIETSYIVPVFGAVLIFYYLMVWGLVKLINIGRLNMLSLKLQNIEREKIQDSIEVNFFTKLVQINFKYLDKYYLQTQIQADKSFGICVFVALLSLAVIITGITMMFFSAYIQKETTSSSIRSSSYIVTSSGVLSEFIAAVFFYLYNQTILKMSEYHQKLVLTQNISLALKISEELPSEEKRIESQQFLIQELTKDINVHLMSKN